MRLGKNLSRKFLISLMCVLFTAVFSLCGANLINAYSLDTNPSYMVEDENQTESGDSESGETSSEGSDDMTSTATPSGKWSSNAKKPDVGKGTQDSPYIVTKPEELAYIIKDSDGVFLVNADLDMSAHYWDLSKDTTFTGCLIGNGTIEADGNVAGIRGINLEEWGYLFEHISDAKIYDIVFEAPIVKNDEKRGGFICTAKASEIKNCAFVAPDGVASAANAGILVTSYGGVTIEGCVNMVNLEPTDDNGQGGIVGEVTIGDSFIVAAADFYTKVIDCVNYGSINGNGHVGGIVGETSVESGLVLVRNSDLEITRCVNYGQLGTNNTSKYVGGIIGYVVRRGIGLNSNDDKIISCVSANSNYTQNNINNGKVGCYAGNVETFSSLTISNCIRTNYKNLPLYNGNAETSGLIVASSNSILSKTNITSSLGDINWGDKYGSNLDKNWTTMSICSTYNNFDGDDMITLSYFVASIDIGLMNEVNENGSTDYKFEYYNDGYYVSVKTSDNLYSDVKGNDANKLNTYHFTKDPFANELFKVSSNNSGKYTYLGIYNGEEETADRITDSNGLNVSTCYNNNATYVAKCGLAKKDYVFKNAYMDDFILDGNDWEYGNAGGYILNCQVDGATYSVNSESGELKIENVSANSKIVLTIKMNENYELFGVFREDNIVGNKIDGNKIVDVLYEGSGVFNHSSINSDATMTYTIDFSYFNTTPFNENKFILLFSRYQYKITTNLTTIVDGVDGENNTTKFVTYGYESRQYARTSNNGNLDLWENIEGEKKKVSIPEVSLIPDSDTQADFFEVYYSYFVCDIKTDGVSLLNKGKDNEASFYWGGGTNFPMDGQNYVDITFSNAPVGISGNQIFYYTLDKNTKVTDFSLNLEKLFNDNYKYDCEINVTIKKFPISVDKEYLKSVDPGYENPDNEDNSFGGKIMTYTFEIVDLYDASVKTSNCYTKDDLGGETIIAVNSDNVTDNEEISMFYAYIDETNKTIVIRVFLPNKFEYGDSVDDSKRCENEYEINSSLDDYVEKKLTDIVNITKTPQKGYYANGDSSDQFVFAKSDEIDESISVDSINSKIEDSKTDSTPLIYLINGGTKSDENSIIIYGTEKTAYLLSYYSLKTIKLEFTTDGGVGLVGSININGENYNNNVNNGDESTGNKTFIVKSYSHISFDFLGYAYVENSNGSNETQISFHKLGSVSYKITVSSNVTDSSNVTVLTDDTDSNKDPVLTYREKFDFQLINDIASNEQEITLTFTANYMEIGNYTVCVPEFKNGYYEIKSEENLYWLAMQLMQTKTDGGEGYNIKNMRFKQICDIYLTKEFVPIGTKLIPFDGIYDGQYYSIYDLSISAENLENIGLFGCVNGATIKNLNLVGGSVSGFSKVGGVVGNAVNSTFKNVNNYSCSVNYNENGFTENHIFVIYEEKGGENNGDGEATQQTTTTQPTVVIKPVSSGDASSGDVGYNEKLLLRYIEDADNNNLTYKFEVSSGVPGNDFTNNSNSSDSGIHIAYSTKNLPYYIAGFAGYIEGGNVTVSSSRSEIIGKEYLPETQNETGDETDQTLDESARMIAGFVGFFENASISYCYTTSYTFDGGSNETTLTCCHSSSADNVFDPSSCDDCNEKFNW